ncbi:MAG: Gfo/Idh/MocA family oxidoreductase [Gammaproteobacteria bacterium]|nr:Gfo/Idh/MocA family oxidoreductase [Gammaproteobacteria bacterium]
MNLSTLLVQREETGKPIRVGLIGAGKFGAMFLAQARLTRGIQVVGIADLVIERARAACINTKWPAEQVAATSFDDALKSGRTFLTESTDDLLQTNSVEVVIEATGDASVGIQHCLQAIENGKHIVMVNVEADVVAGPLLARKAIGAGVIYSLAWGDQPALICEHVDWARATGFNVVCAGKGTRYHPSFHASTPDTVWKNFGWTDEVAERGGANPKMFNSFVDGTKSAIEMTAVCNATGLTPQPDGLSFPPCSVTDLAQVCKPKDVGGTISHAGTTEVVSSINRDMSPVANHLQMGTYVVLEADNDYVRHCFEEYWMLPDDSYHYSALYRPTHLIGLELGISVASIALRNEPTGCPVAFNADIIATAKKDLRAGDLLDGEGGYTVWGKQMPADRSLQIGGLPLGLAHKVKLKRDVALGIQLTWADVDIDESTQVMQVRREMEREFGNQMKAAP